MSCENCDLKDTGCPGEGNPCKNEDDEGAFKRGYDKGVEATEAKYAEYKEAVQQVTVLVKKLLEADKE